MLTFVCEAWEVVMVLATVVGVAGFISIFVSNESKGVGVCIIFICAITLLGFGYTHSQCTQVDNVIGMTVDNATQTLHENNLKVTCFGNSEYNAVVITQSIDAGTWVKKGTEIILNYQNDEFNKDVNNEIESAQTENIDFKTDSSTEVELADNKQPDVEVELVDNKQPDVEVPNNTIIKDNSNELISDVVSGNIINGTLAYKQIKTYKYPVYLTGNYRFNFDINSVNNRYRVKIFDGKDVELESADSKSEGVNVNLIAGNVYMITVESIKNDLEYTITIGVPQDIQVVYNNIIGNINYIGQENHYVYTAPRNGIYGFLLDINDVTQYYNFEIFDSKNNLIERTNSNKGNIAIDLKEGEVYSIIIKYGKGFASYNIPIGVPNEDQIIINDCIIGELTYDGQKDCYIYTPRYYDEYIFSMWIDDVLNKYKIEIRDSVNKTIKTSYSSTKDFTVELEGGETYTIYVIQQVGTCEYEIDIY